MVSGLKNGKIRLMLSIVVPVFNEEEVLEAFFKELTKNLKALGESFEVIFVDDGSADRSIEILEKIHRENKNVRTFSFRKHQGKAEALTLGFKKSNGDRILTIDADLQDRPDQIEKLIRKASEGWDMVSGWRANRKDSIFKKISSKFFNFMASIFWGLKVNDLNCGLKLYSREAAKSLNLYGGMHRFIPLLLHEDGFKTTEVPVIHDKRKLGRSKYSITKVFTELPDMFTMLFLSRYSKRPLHFFAPIGGLAFILGTMVLLYLLVLRIEGYTIGNRPLLFFGLLLVISGLQVFFTGLLADLLISHSGGKSDDEANLKFSSDK